MSVVLRKPQQASFDALLRTFTGEDAAEELLFALRAHDPAVRSIFRHGTLVGVCLAQDGRNGFLYVCLLPQFRGKGCGAAAVQQAYELFSAGMQTCLCTFREGDAAAEAFAKKQGYTRQFCSEVLTYTGRTDSKSALPVRKYRDADFDRAHALYAEAFHRMRCATGCFPDSKPEEASEKIRKWWRDTASERLVYTEDDLPIAVAHIEGDELSSIAVAPERQGQGIGSAFIRCCRDEILASGQERVLLYCVAGNPARRIYQALGFRPLYTAVYAGRKFNKDADQHLTGRNLTDILL